MTLLRSVGTKLFVLFFVSTFASVLVVGLLSYHKSQSIIASKMESVSQQTVKEATEKIALMLKQYEDMSLQFSTSRDLQEAMASVFDPNAETANTLAAKTLIQNALNQIARTNAFIKSITVLSTANENETINSLSAGLIRFDRSAEWYAKTVDMKGTANWLPAKDGGYSGMAAGNLFALSRMVGKSMIVFEIDAAQLTRTLESIHFSESSKMMLNDPQGLVLLSSAPADVGTTFAPDRWNGDHLVVSEPVARTPWTLTGVAPLSELVSDTMTIRNLTVVMSVVAAVVAVGLGYLIILHIGKPLLHIRNLLNEGARGNLTARTKLRRKDEIGEVADSFNLMMERLTRLIEQTRGSAGRVLRTSSNLLGVSRQTSDASREISLATTEIAGGSSQLAAEAESAYRIVESMNADFASVEVAADRINESSAEVKTASAEGTRFMQEIVAGTIESEQSIDLLVDRVGRLEESTEAMQSMLAMLHKITKDSKILSLNAGIEAARNGQATGGFKVIASEMGRLSDQTNESIATVHEMTEAIQEEIVRTVGALKTALPLLQSQIRSVKTANELFASVYEKSEAFAREVDRIKEDVRKLGDKQRRLNASISSVSSFSEEASATSEQVSALSAGQLESSVEVVGIAKELESLSGALEETLAEFKAK